MVSSQKKSPSPPFRKKRKYTKRQRDANPRNKKAQQKQIQAINELVTEYRSASEDRRAEIFWGDQTDTPVTGTGLVKEFDAFLRMYASVIKGVRPDNISSHARQVILYRETEINTNACISRAIDSMDLEELYHDLILVFQECILRYDPDRMHKDGVKKIHFVGFLTWNFKYYVQKMLQKLSREYVEDLAPDESLCLTPANIHGLPLPDRLAGYDTMQEEGDSQSVTKDLDSPDYLGLSALDSYTEGLSLKEKQVISMRYIQKLSCADVAARMRLGKSEVIAITQEAFAKIREAASRKT